VDMVDAFMGNIIPMPATSTKEKFDEMEERLKRAQTHGDFSAVAEALEEEGSESMMEYLRRYALAAVIDPVLVLEDDGDENHIPVTELTRFELLNIFNAEPNQQEAPVVSPERLEEFRGQQPAPAGDAAPAREDVRPETELVDAGNREVVSA